LERLPNRTQVDPPHGPYDCSRLRRFVGLFANVISGELFFDPGSLLRLIGFLLMVALAAWKNEQFHAIAVVAIICCWRTGSE
jgi:hypothetical protein